MVGPDIKKTHNTYKNTYLNLKGSIDPQYAMHSTELMSWSWRLHTNPLANQRRAMGADEGQKKQKQRQTQF